MVHSTQSINQCGLQENNLRDYVLKGLAHYLVLLLLLYFFRRLYPAA